MSFIQPMMMKYIDQLLPPRNEVLSRLEEEAATEGIPNIVPAGASLLSLLTVMKRPQRILEVGTAIGYSGITMLLSYHQAQLTTLEIDPVRAERAVNNAKEAGVGDRFQLVAGDAEQTLPELAEGPFDMVFIDAAKGKYPIFLDHALSKCKEDAWIITDNVLFRGYPALPKEEIPKRYVKLTQKIQHYNTMLMQHPRLQTTVLTVGDGMAVSMVKKEGEAG